jgi:hypothetical protein
VLVGAQVLEEAPSGRREDEVVEELREVLLKGARDVGAGRFTEVLELLSIGVRVELIEGLGEVEELGEEGSGVVVLVEKEPVLPMGKRLLLSLAVSVEPDRDPSGTRGFAVVVEGKFEGDCVGVLVRTEAIGSIVVGIRAEKVVFSRRDLSTESKGESRMRLDEDEDAEDESCARLCMKKLTCIDGREAWSKDRCKTSSNLPKLFSLGESTNNFTSSLGTELFGDKFSVIPVSKYMIDR